METEYKGDESSFVEIESGTKNDSEEKKKEIKPEIKSERKRGKENKYERAISIFERVLFRSKDTDVRFLELKEKRLKLEEHQLELEDRCLKEEQE